jgi:hypothetical protein
VITQDDGNRMCQDVIGSLLAWPALNAALQSGGLEVKASGRIEAILEIVATKQQHVVLREYQHIDFAIISPSSISQSRLQVASVIEVKFNYAQQIGEIVARAPEAIIQANNYRKMIDAANAYVLYFLAAPQIDLRPSDPRDGGWRYWNSPIGVAKDALRASAVEAGAAIVGESPVDDRGLLYCALLQCPERL